MTAKKSMPVTLTLVRHGESESNAVKRAAEKGNPHPNEKKLMMEHTSRRRLTPRGVRQAQRAGEWIHRYFDLNADYRDGGSQIHGYFSPYVRAAETARHLGLPIMWRSDARLTERNWGDLDQLTYEERQIKYSNIENRELHGIYWPAGNGETLQMLSTRMWQHFDMLKRRHSDHHVIQVSHGETMLVERYMLERWLPEDVVHMMLSTDTELSQKVLNQPCDWQNKIINCRIVQYSRIRPDGTLAKNYERVRLVAPSDPDNSKMNLDWQPIVRKEFTSNDLQKYVDRFPHFLSENTE